MPPGVPGATTPRLTDPALAIKAIKISPARGCAHPPPRARARVTITGTTAPTATGTVRAIGTDGRTAGASAQTKIAGGKDTINLEVPRAKRKASWTFTITYAGDAAHWPAVVMRQAAVPTITR